ncbi:50S ribosomal protein L35 [Acidipropionibacterium timonense]|uniref:50S ribosomal protein L35 n=1 Tax=Acidipropionibacterium timonense TaxID=2161818 RepID=UPI001031CEC0|nr:50S ribosomal protein L35 [Acidipropionibacterium timonense]
MPKMKSHSGTKKRFKVTGSGKVAHNRAGKRHLNEHKSSRRTRRLTGESTLATGPANKIKKLLAGRAGR